MLEQETRERGKALLSSSENEKVRTVMRFRSPVIYEIVRREGEEELLRPSLSLCVAGVAAGFAMGFSVLAEALLHASLPQAPWSALITRLGYSFGFLIVIMARLQLFTENTITAVLPICAYP
ncbi:MAG TPA: formate/nitrite transporter family protein, partial [Pararhizobium sp.]|nr:formate/nitrite transporter family protein [Pararhizobium sp.]